MLAIPLGLKSKLLLPDIHHEAAVHRADSLRYRDRDSHNSYRRVEAAEGLLDVRVPVKLGALEQQLAAG